MATPIIIPKLGLITDDVSIVEWKAEEGDWIQRGTVVAVIETQKVEWNVEAEASGHLHIIVAEGGKAAVGSAIGILAESRDELEKLVSVRPPLSDAPGWADVQAPGAAGALTSQAESYGRIKITPVARKMAEEKLRRLL